MNLFILDHDVEYNVRCHVDNHVNKIALEACQLLSCALQRMKYPGVSYDASWWYTSGNWDSSARESVHRAYAITHGGHPLNNWCTDPVNYMWTLRYAIELCKEHRFRKGTVIQQWRMLSQLPRFTVYNLPTKWYAAVTDNLLTAEELRNGKYVTSDRVVEVYRQYYARDKVHLHNWTGRDKPEWIDTYKPT